MNVTLTEGDATTVSALIQAWLDTAGGIEGDMHTVVRINLRRIMEDIDAQIAAIMQEEPTFAS